MASGIGSVKINTSLLLALNDYESVALLPSEYKFATWTPHSVPVIVASLTWD